MQKQIQLTFNLKGSWKDRDSQLLTEAASNLGYELKIMSSFEMRQKSLPYAVLNGGGSLNETHLRYLRSMELSGVKHLNPCYKVVIAEDKALSNLEIGSLGFSVPKTIDLHVGLRNPNMAAYIEREIGFPCIIKHPKSAIGVGIHLVKTREEFRDLYDLIYTCSMRYMDFQNTVNFVAQELIPETKNKDIRVFVLDGKILGAMLRENPIGWNVKRVEWAPGFPETHADINYERYKVDQDLENKILRITSHLGLRFAGYDVLFGGPDNKYVFGEVNPCPGLNNFNNLCPEVGLPEQVIRALTGENND